MAQAIPSKPQAADSQLVTPNATPPTSTHVPTPTPFSENRLQQLLAHFDSGTHEFDRAERETALEKRMNWDSLPTPPHSQPSSRRPSFLSSLSLTRFSSHSHPPSSGPSSGASTPAQTPITSTHPHLPTSLQMTSSSSPQTADPIQRPKSTPTMSTATALSMAAATKESLDRTTVPPPMESNAEGPTAMQRSNTMPHTKGGPGGSGFGFLHRKASMGQGMGAKPAMSGLTSMDMNQEKRHFDPSKEPRLLGLL